MKSVCQAGKEEVISECLTPLPFTEQRDCSSLKGLLPSLPGAAILVSASQEQKPSANAA